MGKDRVEISTAVDRSLKAFIETVGAGKDFVIPDYQRGYIWGNTIDANRTDAVTYMCESILKGYRSQKELFLQGITYCRDKEGNAVLVDGQQRTTFFYILLKFLNFNGNFNIRYDVREESDKYLKRLDINSYDKQLNNPDAETQDIYFFKKTVSIIRKSLIAKVVGKYKADNDEDEETDNCETEVKLINSLREYVLNKIKFIFIEIDIKDSTLVFTMMNGNKAQMEQPELIKSELLRISSRNTEEIGEIENIQLRGRMAREWDKWLYWWRRKDVEALFGKESDKLGWLLKVYLDSEVTLENFKQGIGETVGDAKREFRKLRLLQKKFEDIFNDPRLYNYVGFILRTLDNYPKEKLKFLKWFIVERSKNRIPENKEALKFYFDASMIGMPHNKIVQNIDNETFSFGDYASDFLEILKDSDLYRSNRVKADLWYLRRNILEDNNQGEDERGRKFDFSIWDNKSLEHILPKSKFYHYGDIPTEPLTWDDKLITEDISGMIDRASIPGIIVDSQPLELSEHSLGNMVLLYGNNNSAFGADEFEKKKEKLFSPTNEMFKSRHLLHTVKVFGNSYWSVINIAENAVAELNAFGEAYIPGNKIASLGKRMKTSSTEDEEDKL